MSKPIIYLAFANDENAHLAVLKEESRQLMSILGPLHDKEAVEVYRDESTSVHDLIESFERFDGRFAIFHYGGHAGGSSLHLEAGHAHANGIAELLSRQKDLQLVFLNGCSTYAQVERLMQLGIKAVIATSVAIADIMAKDFSSWFYRALVAKKSIKSAFYFAVSALHTQYGDSSCKPALIEYRGGLKLDIDADIIPWGLYINEQHKETLNWRLPDRPIQRLLPHPLDNYSPNDYLPKILGAMANYDPSLKRIIDEVKSGKMDKREVLPIIIQKLPWTIGAQLQKLISRSESMRKAGLERLQQSIQTYIVTAQVLLYILVSQYWEEQRKSQSGNAPQQVNELLILNENSAQFFDYIDTLGKIGKVFIDNGWQPFVSKFSDLFTALTEKGPFYKAYLLLESIREQLASGRLNTSSVPQLCEEAENSLTIFIGTISFLINYKMVAIRDIFVTSSRYQTVNYLHKLGSLNAADSAYLTLESDPRPFKNHTESGAILLVDDLDHEKISRFLSLSPFIIDNNVFLDKSRESLDIYLYSHVENGEYVYKNVNSQFQKMISQNAYSISTGYEEKVEVKDEVDIGWEFNESSVKILRPYALLKTQFEIMKKELINAG
ncbi:MAG: CHAT domain-containing protein [Saprospiraceae bacterium]|nr:CHAT domain-containing protein [Lewinella sp.]